MLEEHVEQQATAHACSDGVVDPGPGGSLPERGELLAVREVRREQPVPLLRVVSCLGDDAVHQGVEVDGLVADGVTQHRAQGERMGPGLHEAGTVCGVLHRVGEDERLLLRRVEPRGAEQARQRDRQQRRDGGAQESDAVLLPARRAVVVV
ncbi:MAG: hypothetical protein ACTIME_15570 [Cellulosimicrobium funkei]|uniref:hypothetical protein n=1 Tax=Cellulosimicrobium funkei TaxID=264251 RepID=UPI003F9850A4